MRRLHPSLPPSAPRNGGPASRWIGRCVLRLGGWRMTGEFPDVERMIIIVAPHSSAWDAIWAIGLKLALGLDVAFMGKRELFRGPLGWLLRKLGGFPVNRASTDGVVEQVAARYREHPRLWVALAPEGTRRRVEHWKSGFWRIARAAEVPVLCVYFHYPERIIGIGPLLQTSASLEDDMARIRAFYAPWLGKRRGTL
jgi:1-acyl-sn-glycerol-3-phosphate acyltransferase